MSDRETQTILNEQKTILNEERKILAEEKSLLAAIRKERSAVAVLALATVIGLLVTGIYLWSLGGAVKTDKAQITVPTIALAPQGSGKLEELYVHEGDEVKANQAVARVGNELIKAKVDGQVIAVSNNVGKLFNRGEAVVTMIDPSQLRVVVRIDEDKGLKDLHVGQLASFTVDAFGSRKYAGMIDEISPTSRESGIVFNISDKRDIKQFNVFIRFDVAGHPELKNGMSAKVTIFTK